MRWSGIRSLLVVALVAAALAGCSSDTGTTPTPPSGPITETLTGTLLTSATSYHTLTVKTGQVTATLTALSPGATLKLTLIIGVYNPYYGTCTPVAGNDAAGVGIPVMGLATATTNLCFSLGDPVPVIPAGVTENYTITVVHY